MLSGALVLAFWTGALVLGALSGIAFVLGVRANQ
ncbi:Uncharacterised protein [Xylophilus ampelinus]|jgi:hypothetical protein|nr:Uncharacterised protein [Xylophilus ampelinus]